MLTGELRRHSSAACLTLLPSGVLVVRMSGPITSEAMQGFKSQIVERYGGRIRAFVVNFKCAAIACDGPGLDAVINGEDPNAVPRLPAAMVVDSAMVDLFAAHALRMAALGVMRRVFAQQEPAVCWAESEVMRAHQQPGRRQRGA